MSVTASLDRHAAESSLRWGCLALMALAIVAGVALRFRHLGTHFNHFDEVFPVALITHARATGNLDLNVRDADVSAGSRYNPYADSSYHYALLGWDAVMRVFRGWPEDNRNRPSLLRLRAFSAVLGSAALVLLALIAWRVAGPLGSFVATTLMALNPTLVQDSHYARPEAFILFLTLIFLLLVGQRGPPRLRSAIWAGVILGVLVAARNTMGLLAVVPGLWLIDRPTRGDAGKAIAACGAAMIVAFALTEPGAWLHFDDFIDGVRRLQVQNSNSFPVSGPLGGGASYGMAIAYFTATLGIGTFVLALAGLVVAIRRREWITVVLWAAPIVVYGAYFGSKTIFFEREFSPFLPGVFVLAGLAVAALGQRIAPRLVVALGLTAIAVLPGALVSIQFVGGALSGRYDQRRVEYDRTIEKSLPHAPIVVTPMWSSGHLDPLLARWEGDHTPFIICVADCGDAWTKRMYTQLLTRLPAHEFAVLPGPFDKFPVSTLQLYHVPTWRYVWIGPLSADPFPSVPPAEMDLANRILANLANAPWRYAALAWVLGAIPFGLALCAVFQESGKSGGSSAGRNVRVGWLFPASVAVALFAFRWPAFFHHPELNVDEAHTIAGGITLSYDPVYWRSVDGTTHGPMNDFVLLWPRLFGWPIDFLTARVLACGLVAGLLIWLWAGTRKLWGEAMARLAVLPILAFFAFSTFWDFVHASSEHLTLFLLATGWAALVLAGRRSRPRRWRDTGWWGLAGLALGLVPWAKMQGGPIAALLAVYGLVAAWRQLRPERGASGHGLAAFLILLVLPSAFVAIHLSAFRLWPDFWQSYVVNNIRYATQTKMFTVPQMLRMLPSWLGQTEGLVPLVLGGVGIALASQIWVRRFTGANWRQIVFALALAVGSLYTAVAPGRQFHHYLLMAVVPFAMLPAVCFASAWQSAGRARLALAALFVGATVVPQIVAKAQRPNPFLADVSAYPNRISRVAQIICHYARAGEPLGIWGFMPRYYVETGLPQASREGHNERQLLPHPQLGYYRSRYLADLRAHRPPVFLDAVGPGVFWPHDRNQFGHETWPELRDWVAANYSIVDDLDGVRIYVRNDRLPALP